ncbi:endoplasmic reticulum metallopeptidase 1-like [Euwallacea similis]|uniref:endoplasmic reticulum metallopeptidase 1-like n=1 Tax=Euwallacea similis TaxID=1736056 RepID=UPI003450C2FB
MPRPKSKYIFGSRELKISIHSIPYYIGIALVVLFAFLFWIVYLVDGILPTPLTINDELKNPHAFITERATWDLKNLTNIGPRVVGSYENEVVTVDYLQNRIIAIIQEKHPNQFLEQDLQLTSGAYYLTSQKRAVINTYDKVQNIAVKLSGRNGTYSILINSHFDSVPTSSGASDDGINVAAMLEILRIFSKEAEKPLHNIVFLFNGAEETPLQASHGFITQHKWAKECKVIVNLDACGSGGKIILFQTGPDAPWLIKFYNGVPHPFGQVAGEELFQTGLLPSDTDFRIFRDYGKLVGLDMAFIKNGYRYHTKHDRFSYIPFGSYQHVGDNALYLLKSLSNAPEVSQPLNMKGKAVYFDVFGWFFVHYTNFIGQIINVSTVMLSLVVFIYSLLSFKLAFSRPTLKFLPVATGAILGSWILSVLFVVVLAILLDLLGKTMTWFGQPWLIFGLYVVPVLGLSGILLFLTNHENISLSIRCQIQAHLVRLIFTVILAFGTAFNVRTAYALMIPILFSSIAFIVIHATSLHRSVKYWLIIYILFLILPSMNLMYQALTTFSLFIPMTGLIGSDKNPDMIIGSIAAVFSILIFSPLTALTNALRNARYFFAFVGLLFVISIILLFTPLGFPYSAKESNPTPQRQWILHTSRKFFNESGDLSKSDAGFFLLNLDRNSPNILKGYVKDLARAVPLSDDCERYAGCGMPLSHHRMIKIVPYSTWIPAEEPVLPEPLNMTYVTENVSSTEVKYNIKITGTDRLTIYIIPKEDVSMQNISFVAELNSSHITFQGRPMYFIYRQLGTGELKHSFTFNVRTQTNWIGPTVNLTVVGRYVHPSRMKKTAQYLELIQQMPQWTDVTAWLGTNYVYQI